MFIRYVPFKKLQSLSSLCLKECVFYAKISTRTVYCAVVPNPKLPPSKFMVRMKVKRMKRLAVMKRIADKLNAVHPRDTIFKICNILRYSTWDDAQGQLQRLSVKWESWIVNQVLKTHPPMEKAWLFFNWVKKLERFKHDQYTYTTMLDIFGEAGRIPSMMFVFQEMKDKGMDIDAVTYTSMLHWLSNDGGVDGAIRLWKEMLEKGCSPTVVSYTAYMKILFDHNRESDAVAVYKEMLEEGLSPTCHTYTVLMVHLANSGKFDKVLEIFMKMKDVGTPPDKAACNILMEKCSKAGKTSEMTKILLYMKANELVLRYPVYVEAVSAFRKAGESEILLRHVNRHICSESSSQCAEGPEQCALDVNDATSDEIIILMLLKKNSLVAVDHILSDLVNESIQLDSRLISTIIEVNVASERQSGALLAFDYSVNRGTTITHSAYLGLIGLFVRSNLSLKVVEIVEKMIRDGLSPGTQLSALLIYRLGCAREHIASGNLFDVLPTEEKNTATYTALIGAYFASGYPGKAMRIFEIMKLHGIKVALGTYCIFLAGLEKSRKHKQVASFKKEMKSLHAESISQVTSEEEVICNLLFSGTLLV